MNRPGYSQNLLWNVGGGWVEENMSGHSSWTAMKNDAGCTLIPMVKVKREFTTGQGGEQS
jgi:hypothetical protein